MVDQVVATLKKWAGSPDHLMQEVLKEFPLKSGIGRNTTLSFIKSFRTTQMLRTQSNSTQSSGIATNMLKQEVCASLITARETSHGSCAKKSESLLSASLWAYSSFHGGGTEWWELLVNNQWSETPLSSQIQTISHPNNFNTSSLSNSSQGCSIKSTSSRHPARPMRLILGQTSLGLTWIPSRHIRPKSSSQDSRCQHRGNSSNSRLSRLRCRDNRNSSLHLTHRQCASLKLSWWTIIWRMVTKTITTTRWIKISASSSRWRSKRLRTEKSGAVRLSSGADGATGDSMEMSIQTSGRGEGVGFSEASDVDDSMQTDWLCGWYLAA